MTSVRYLATVNPKAGNASIPRLTKGLYKAAWLGFSHSIFPMAKSAAYSAILSIFPALLVLTTLFAIGPSGDAIRSALGNFLGQILPPDTMQLVVTYCQSNHARSVHLVWAAGFVSISGAMGVIFSLMEGFRRAYRLPRSAWAWWWKPFVAFMLVPATLIPEACATLFLIYGHNMERWMILNSDQRFHVYVVLLWRAIRWMIALTASVTVLMVVYYFGVPRRRGPMHSTGAKSRAIGALAPLALTTRRVPPNWRAVFPGALLATVAWFIVTLLYGLYLSRFSDHSIVYGSLSAAVVTLVWLYMVSLCILMGAEFNAQLSLSRETY